MNVAKSINKNEIIWVPQVKTGRKEDRLPWYSWLITLLNEIQVVTLHQLVKGFGTEWW